MSIVLLPECSVILKMRLRRAGGTTSQARPPAWHVSTFLQNNAKQSIRPSMGDAKINHVDVAPAWIIGNYIITSILIEHLVFFGLKGRPFLRLVS